MSLLVLWPAHCRDCSEKTPKGWVAVQATELPSPVRAGACGPGALQISGGLAPLGSPGSVSSGVHHGARARSLRLAASRSWQKKFFSLPRAPEARPPPSSLPGGGALSQPGISKPPRQRQQEAKPLLMLFCGAPARPPGEGGGYRPALPGAGGPPSARAQCLTRGRGSDSCQRRRRWRWPSVCAEEKPETDPLALPLPFPVRTSSSSSLWTQQGLGSLLRRAALHSVAVPVARPGGK